MVMLQGCLNASRRRSDHASCPTTPEELARHGMAAVAAGATALHVHPRDDSGDETLEGELVAASLEVMRASVSVPNGRPKRQKSARSDLRFDLQTPGAVRMLPTGTPGHLVKGGESQPSIGGGRRLDTACSAGGGGQQLAGRPRVRNARRGWRRQGVTDPAICRRHMGTAGRASRAWRDLEGSCRPRDARGDGLERCHRRAIRGV